MGKKPLNEAVAHILREFGVIREQDEPPPLGPGPEPDPGPDIPEPGPVPEIPPVTSFVKPSKAKLRPIKSEKVAKAYFKKNIEPYLSSDERAEYKGKKVDIIRNIVNLFRNLPDNETYRVAAWEGRSKRGWYAKSAAEIIKLFGGQNDDAARFCGLLAALSSSQGVGPNLLNGLKVWNEWEDAGRPTDPDEITEAFDRALGPKSKKMEGWIKGSIRMLSSEHEHILEPQYEAIEGQEQPELTDVANKIPGVDYKAFGEGARKIESFRQNLMNDLWRVTNDSWMAHFARMNPDKISSKEEYLAYTAKVRGVAEELGWTPAEVQETVWSFYKAIVDAAKPANLTKSGLFPPKRSKQLAKPAGERARDLAAYRLHQGDPEKMAEFGIRLDEIADFEKFLNQVPDFQQLLVHPRYKKHVRQIQKRLGVKPEEGTEPDIQSPGAEGGEPDEPRPPYSPGGYISGLEEIGGSAVERAWVKKSARLYEKSVKIRAPLRLAGFKQRTKDSLKRIPMWEFFFGLDPDKMYIRMQDGDIKSDKDYRRDLEKPKVNTGLKKQESIQLTLAKGHADIAVLREAWGELEMWLKRAASVRQGYLEYLKGMQTGFSEPNMGKKPEIDVLMAQSAKSWTHAKRVTAIQESEVKDGIRFTIFAVKITRKHEPHEFEKVKGPVQPLPKPEPLQKPKVPEIDEEPVEEPEAPKVAPGKMFRPPE